MPGKNLKNEAEVKMASPEGLYLSIEGRGYFAAFKDHPYLAELPLSQIFEVEYCGHGHIRWEAGDIDLHVDILENPEKYPIITHNTTAAELGRKGGSARSVRKSAAARSNGAKGGRPRKKPETALA